MLQLCLTQGSEGHKTFWPPNPACDSGSFLVFHAGVDQRHGHPQAKWKQTLNCLKDFKE